MQPNEFSQRWQQEQHKKRQQQERTQQQTKTNREAYYNDKLNKLFNIYDKLLFQPEDGYKLAVVGELKGGKSTFLNAIIGDTILHAKSSAATAFPLRIVHKNGMQGIELKYYYSPNALSKFKRTLNITDISGDDLALVTGFLTDIKEVHSNLTSDATFHQVEKLNYILRILAKYETIEVEEFLTAIVPEITVNFRTFELLGYLDLSDNTILIDTPGIGEDSSLNTLFEHLITHITGQVDSNVLILEKGGRNTKYEDIVIETLKTSKNFSVIASKLDDYDEDMEVLLQNKIPNQFKDFKGFQGVYGVSQARFLSGVKVLNDFAEHGKIIDTREPYIGDLIQEFHGRKEFKKYKNQEENYEDLLQSSPDFKTFINNEYIGGSEQQVTNFLSNLNCKVHDYVYYLSIIRINANVQKLYKTIFERDAQKKTLLNNSIFNKELWAHHVEICENCANLFETQVLYKLYSENTLKPNNYNSIIYVMEYNKGLLLEGKKTMAKKLNHLKSLKWASVIVSILWIYLFVNNNYNITMSNTDDLGVILIGVVIILYMYYRARKSTHKLAIAFKKSAGFFKEFKVYSSINPKARFDTLKNTCNTLKSSIKDWQILTSKNHK